MSRGRRRWPAGRTRGILRAPVPHWRGGAEMSIRPRRLRFTPAMRRLVRETALTPADFIYPLFVCPGEGVKREISAMPGNYQMSVDKLVEESREVVALARRHLPPRLPPLLRARHRPRRRGARAVQHRPLRPGPGPAPGDQRLRRPRGAARTLDPAPGRVDPHPDQPAAALGAPPGDERLRNYLWMGLISQAGVTLGLSLLGLGSTFRPDYDIWMAAATLSTLPPLIFFLILWFLAGIFFVPTFLKRTRNLMNDETMLIVCVGLCLLMVMLAVEVGFSAALGAFIMGSILAETTQAERIEHLIKSVKDLFAAIFFVSVGMMIDPRVLQDYALPLLIIILITIAGKFLTTAIGALLSGQSLKHPFAASQQSKIQNQKSKIPCRFLTNLRVSATMNSMPSSAPAKRPPRARLTCWPRTVTASRPRRAARAAT